MPNSDKYLKAAFELLQTESNKTFAGDLTQKITEAVLKAKAIDAAVESATKLTEDEKNLLEQQVEKSMQRELNFSYAIKPQLYGGFKVTVGDWILDATIDGKLNSLRQYLIGEK